MIAIDVQSVQNIQNNYRSDIEKQRKAALEKLKDFKKNTRIQFSTCEKNYLDQVINLFEQKDILLTSPNDIKDLKTAIGTVPLNSRKKGKKTLKQFIIDKLDYKGLRKTFYPQYFNDIGIKACVYCNAVLTISTEKIKPRSIEHKGNFDVDHYHSKDDYPFLSIFLFNLYPSCAPCNRKKSKSTKISFELYSDNPANFAKSDFKFKLDPGAKAKFLLTKNSDDLHFDFDSANSGFQETFGIQQIYETQKDLIEELMVKKLMYDKCNRMSLYNSFSKLQLHPDLYLRTLVGNYIKENEIHKRPMSKFMQDIARDLGIID